MPVSTFKTISVIVPALNEGETIGRALAALAELLLPPEMTMEIIVADNGSSDRTVAVARQTAARVVVKEGVHIGALRNFAAAHGHGELLAFVDADCLVSREWLRNALACLAREGAAAAGSHHLLPPGAGWLARTGEIIQRGKTGYIPAGNLIVTRQAFFAVGGFDESLETNEDVDLCRRLRRNGFKLCLDPKIAAYHLGYPQGMLAMIRRELWHGKNTATLFLRELGGLVNGRIVIFSLINLILLAGMAVAAIVFLLGGNIYLLAWVGGYLAFNLLAALGRYGGKPGALPRVMAYVLVYGLGRSLGLARSIVAGCGNWGRN